MVERGSILDEKLNRSDLETILQVNKKAIEISSEVSSQNEVMIDHLNTIKFSHINLAEKIDKAIEQNESISRDLFQIKVLFLGAAIQIVLQVIQLFIKH